MAKKTGFKGSIAKFNEESFDNKDSATWFHNTAVNSKLIWLCLLCFWKLIFRNFSSLFFIVSLFVVLINHHSQKEYIDDMLTDVKDMITVVFVISIAHSIGVLLRVTNMQDYFVIELSRTIENSQKGKHYFSGLTNVTFPILGKSVHNVDPNLLSRTIAGYV